MDVRSLGYRTDLALLRYDGSEIEDRGDHLVIRSPDNPTFWWGNVVLVDGPPAPGAGPAQRWLDVFERSFPNAAHVAIGVDGVTGTVADLAGFVELGLHAEVSAVMTAHAVREPPHPNQQAICRTLNSDQDWADLVELTLAVDERHEDADHRAFAEGRARTARRLSESGHGAWFGAFVDGRLSASMGLVRADDELARFQNVQTHQAARGQGLAGTLVYHAAQYGLQTLGVQTLVMVADPEYAAIRLYRALGFTAAETQLGVEQPPA